MALSPEEFNEITNEVMRRLGARKPVLKYGNPKFTGSKPVGLNREGLVDDTLLPPIPIGLLPSTLATDAEVAAGYSPLGHAHSGADITSGTVADARIASTIARDSEVAAAYSLLGHTHTSANLTDYTGTTTWTPQLRFGGAAPVGITYAGGTPVGKYGRMGNLYVASFDFTLTAKGAQAGVAAVYGLPVVVNATTGSTCAIYWQTLLTNFVAITGVAVQGQSAIGLYGLAAAGVTLASLTNVNIAATTRLMGTLLYLA